MENKAFYEPKEIAEMYGVSQQTVYTWIKTGKLNAIKLGQWKIPKESLPKLFSQGESKKRGQE